MSRAPASRVDLRPWAALLAALLVLPLVARPVISAEIWIFAIAALAQNLLLGYTGLLSFGQASFFGVGAYAAGLLLVRAHAGLLQALGAGILAGAGAAAVIGVLCARRTGLYFVMLSFAFNQMVYFLAYEWRTLTGGEDGLPGVPRPPLALGGVTVFDLRGSLAFYILTGAVFLAAFALMKRLVESPLGLVWQAIRENEARAASAGYNVAYYKWLAFMIAGAFTGLGGALYAMLYGIVPIDAVHWLTSGNILFMTLIGGISSLYGPIVGAAIFIALSEWISRLWERWPLLLGLVFLAVVFFFRGGAVEAWTRLGALGRPGSRRGRGARGPAGARFAPDVPEGEGPVS